MSRSSDDLLRQLGYGVIAVSGAMGIGAIVSGVQADEVAAVTNVAILVPAFLLAASLAMRSRPGNGAVWALAGAGFFGAASSFGIHLASARSGIGVEAIEGGVIPGAPADYDTLTALGISVSLWAWIPAVFLLGTVLLILFPDGRAPSRWWRAAVWVAGGCMLVLSLQGALALAPWVTTPYKAILEPNDGSTMAPPLGFLMLLLLAVALAAVGRVVLRYRRTTGEERLQYRWVSWALGLYVVVGIFLYTALLGLGAIGDLVSILLLANIPVSIAVAITKRRLYDIDIVISRTLVYGSLAAFIGVVYVAVVVGLGVFVGSGDEPNRVLAVAATAFVAVAFQTVRRRLERLANRVVFGRKATPYEVLSEFSHRVAVTSDDLLDEVARSLAEGTRADRVVVSIVVDGESLEAAAWPEQAGDLPIESVSFPIEDGDVTLGSLDVFLRPGQDLREDDRRLAEQLASGMGLALRNQLLTDRLEARVEELRDSRRRLVAVQDETRRKLERDLHDGAQQQLVALKLKLGMGTTIAERDGAIGTAEILGRLSVRAAQAVDAMREFARGVYPPLLEAEGLPAAVNAQARQAPIRVNVHTDGVGRLPREIEAALYFCVLEALRNALQHADATEVRVTLTQSNGTAEFQVTDDGAGFDTDNVHGSGLTTMTDRIDALFGELAIHSEPGHGTTLTGTIPLSAAVST